LGGDKFSEVVMERLRRHCPKSTSETYWHCQNKLLSPPSFSLQRLLLAGQEAGMHRVGVRGLKKFGN